MASDPDRIVKGIQIGKQQEIKQSAADALNDGSARSHSREDAVSDRQFERMLTATYQMDKDWKGLEARFALFACGRLGMRGGEVTHFHEDWLRPEKDVVEIPEYWNCEKGKRDGEVCGYCRRRALDHVRANNLSIEDAVAAIQHTLSDAELERLDEDDLVDQSIKLRKEVNVTLAEACSERWEPKTPNSAREIPTDFDVRVEMCLERFFEKHSQWPKSKATLNRRIDEVAEVYPHCLRATAAGVHASRDVSVYALMSIFGWSDPSTARTYIRANSDRANREVRSKHR